jgi:hypothetical protein
VLLEIRDVPWSCVALGTLVFSLNPTDGGRRDGGLGCDLLAGPVLAAQSLDLLDDLLWRWLAQPMRPRAAVFKSCRTFDTVPGKPFTDVSRADVYG